MELILGLILIGVVWFLSTSTDRKFNNYMPTEGQRIDFNAQALDRVKNHLTKEEVMRNTVNGKYNTKDFM